MAKPKRSTTYAKLRPHKKAPAQEGYRAGACDKNAWFLLSPLLKPLSHLHFLM